MALGGMILRGITGRMLGRGIATGTGAGATALGLIGGTVGVGMGIKKSLFNSFTRGTSFTNPMFNNVTGQAYGKRGIDANNLNTNGLVQSLHSNRRRS